MFLVEAGFLTLQNLYHIKEMFQYYLETIFIIILLLYCDFLTLCFLQNRNAKLDS